MLLDWVSAQFKDILPDSALKKWVCVWRVCCVKSLEILHLNQKSPDIQDIHHLLRQKTPELQWWITLNMKFDEL